MRWFEKAASMNGVVLAASVLAASVLSAQGMAVATDVFGGVAWADGGRLEILAEVPLMRKILLENSARLTLIMLESGEELTFSGPGRLQFGKGGVIQGTSPSSRRKISAALNGVLALRKDKMARAGVVMREYGPGETMALKPARGAKALYPRHTFRWKPFAGDFQYRLIVRDAQDKVLFEGDTRECYLTLPEEKALKEGENYQWTVNVLMGEKVLHLHSGALSLLSKAERMDVEAEKPTPGASFSDQLLYVFLLEKHDLVGEARQQWQKLKAQRPDISLPEGEEQ